MRPQSSHSAFHHIRMVPRMSWSVANLYNIWLRTVKGARGFRDTEINTSHKSLFQQRWIAKNLTKGYHADQISTKKFERWYLPATLPLINNGGGAAAAATSELSKWVDGREAAGGRSLTQRRIAEMEKEASSPVGTMMFSEVERRIDTLIFRACFATSVYQARNFVVSGHVKINGRLVRNANTLLNPGDIFSVNPKVVPMLSKPEPGQSTEAAAPETEAAAEEAVAEVKEEGAEEAVEAAESATEKPEGAEEAEATAADAETAEKAESEDAAEAAAAAAKRAEWDATKSQKSAVMDGVEVEGTYFTLPDYASPNIFVPAYILPSYLTCSAVYIRHPTARPGYSEIPSPYDAGGPMNSLSWEWYQRVAPRMRPNRRERLMNPQRTQDRK